MSAPICLFSKVSRALTEIWPGTSARMTAGRPQDIHPENFLSGLIFRSRTTAGTFRRKFHKKFLLSLGHHWPFTGITKAFPWETPKGLKTGSVPGPSPAVKETRKRDSLSSYFRVFGLFSTLLRVFFGLGVKRPWEPLFSEFLLEFPSRVRLGAPKSHPFIQGTCVRLAGLAAISPATCAPALCAAPSASRVCIAWLSNCLAVSTSSCAVSGQ